MRALSAATSILVTWMVLGCSSGKEAGIEGGACYGNGTCNAELVCLSQLCVQPPTKGAPPAAAASAISCDDAVNHAMVLVATSDKIKGASPEEKKMAEGLMVELKRDMVKECAERHWTQEQLQCVMRAHQLAELEPCDTKVGSPADAGAHTVRIELIATPADAVAVVDGTRLPLPATIERPEGTDLGILMERQGYASRRAQVRFDKDRTERWELNRAPRPSAKPSAKAPATEEQWTPLIDKRRELSPLEEKKQGASK